MAVPGKLNNELSDLSRHRVVAILEAKLCYCRFKARNELGDIFWLKRNPLALKQRLDHFRHRATLFGVIPTFGAGPPHEMTVVEPALAASAHSRVGGWSPEQLATTTPRTTRPF